MRKPLRSLPGATVIAVFALAAVLLVPSAAPVASAQTVADIEARDRLITNQEALLNVYRCMFDVDTEIVPGGCADGRPTLPVSDPEPFTGAPTGAELTARDKLIGDQELLLNVYRCLFGIDSEIVPGGCVAGRPYPTFTAQPPAGADAFTAVDAGWWHTCAIRSGKTTEAGNVACWGAQNARQTYPPPGRFAHIASGGIHSCGIRDDLTIACWGFNPDGRADPPDGQFTGIAAGGNHSCAIRTDQSIVCWGSNRMGQADAPEGRYKDITAGNDHTCAIREDQTIACWGTQADMPSTAPKGRYREIASRGWHSCAIRYDWTIACWGFHGAGQDYAPDGHYAKVATGNNHSCAIRNDWTIACWGVNDIRPDRPARRAIHRHHSGEQPFLRDPHRPDHRVLGPK